MQINFEIVGTPTVEKLKELIRVVESVGQEHFGQLGIDWCIDKEKRPVVKVVVFDYTFLQDLEKAKEELYKAKNEGDFASFYMKDFISEVQEHCSCGVKII